MNTTTAITDAWPEALIERCEREGHHHCHTWVAGELAAEILLCYLDNFHGMRVVVDTLDGPVTGTVSHLMWTTHREAGGVVVKMDDEPELAPARVPWTHARPLAPGADPAPCGPSRRSRSPRRISRSCRPPSRPQADDAQRGGCAEHDPDRCPSCDSPSPSMHPSTAPEGGEVYTICRDRFHILRAGDALMAEALVANARHGVHA